MARKGNWRGTEHERKYHIRCEWCGVLFCSARDLTRTCSDAHRQALARRERKQRATSRPPADART